MQENQQKPTDAKIALESHLSSLENSILVSQMDGSEINAESALYDLEKVRLSIAELLK